MGCRFEEKDKMMQCHMCGSIMEPIVTDFPFKVHPNTIIIVKGLPVLQCSGCREYLFADDVMEKLEGILDTVDEWAELEILKYAA
jgi:YgiT-type zinc finger domain-containing protein